MSGNGALVGVVNAGSSSLKFALYDRDDRIVSGQVEGIGVRPAMKARDAAGQPLETVDFADAPPASPADALLALLPWLREQMNGAPLAAIGHRVVHGGPRCAGPERVTPALLDELSALEKLAPLHQPHNLAPIRVALERIPEVAQIACFDTSFHRSVPEVAQAYAIPQALADRGVRRYGFHGLSYEYIASRLPDDAPDLAQGRVIVAHLGNGASLCAMHEGRSVATTMGFSALDGLPMGTRCGELDPAVVLYLLQEEGMEADAVADLLYRQCGMLGLSGVSSDFRNLLASNEERAKFAIDVFVYRVGRAIASLAGALGGLDGIVFTAGVGENAPAIRDAICRACAWLGVELDPAANASGAGVISVRDSRVAVLVIPTDENLVIARHTRAALTD